MRLTTVFIAGAFDLFHRGHLNILTRSRAFGDRLVVGINDDEYLAGKGPGRPVDRAPTRIQKLMRTRLVDEIHVFSGTPLELIQRLKPNVITVGDDYTVESTVGYPQCLSWGGRIEVLPRTPGISTTDLVRQQSIAISSRQSGKTNLVTEFRDAGIAQEIQTWQGVLTK